MSSKIQDYSMLNIMLMMILIGIYVSNVFGYLTVYPVALIAISMVTNSVYIGRTVLKAKNT